MFEPGLLKGKKILVTGGGTGLGASMGHRFLELGAELVICGRRSRDGATPISRPNPHSGSRPTRPSPNVRPRWPRDG